MGALQSLRPAVGGIVRNPVLVLVAALFGVAQIPNLLVQPTAPMLATAISLVTTGVLVFVLPFFQGGVIGMADEAIGGKTGLDTLVREGKANYISLLLGYFALLALNLIFGFLAFFGGFIVLIGGAFGQGGVAEGGSAGAGSGSASAGMGGFGFDPTTLAIVAVVAIVLLLAYLLVTFLIQFYAHAVVLDDAELVDGFRRSVGLVRRNLLSTLGYTVLLTVGGAVLGLLAAGASIASGAGTVPIESLPEPSLPLMAAGTVVYLVLTGVLGAFYATYSVAFYRSISAA
ncbi:hypothetical protein GJ633_14080 [Halorubrum sp. CBA1125]|uniref:DUF7847 domain-containing protein n=1 Tax=Halorubrum sp. CBA1125 TaxID=2668072 RepID=UPI0012E8867A|nr:hypothetical protein [Halorubrum sp. CBA1125]MUW15631.1 hypothetical protein [Halorubrum sp. CBA1125]